MNHANFRHFTKAIFNEATLILRLSNSLHE